MKRQLLLTALLLLTLPLLISGCATPSATGGGDPNSTLYMVIFLVLIFGVFYFLMIRPQRKRQKETEKMQQQLGKGDKVITAGGIYGTIESMDDESLVLKIESGQTIRVARGSVVGRRVK